MPKCCVKDCNSKYSKKAPLISLHRLPKNEKFRRQWMESLGQENIDNSHTNSFVCSLHFEESCINRTLDIVRLQENAIPTRLPKDYLRQGRMPLSAIVSNVIPVQEDNIKTLNQDQNMMRTTTLISAGKEDEGDISISNLEPVQPGTSTMTNPDFKVVQKLKERCAQQQKKIKRLNAKCRRQSKKLADFRDILQDLKKRNLINNEGTIMLEECSGPKDFLTRQLAKSRGLPLERQYSEEIRKFALTLHFLSPAAYNFIRKSYNTCLPHTRTLSKWYQKLDAEPGFTKEAFDVLKLKVQMSDRKLLCTLVMDEMSIRKSLTWDPRKQKYYGRVDMGHNFDSDSLEEASQCLVLLLTCINDSWKLPVGYFFVTSLTGAQKCNLVRICLQMTEEAGVNVVALTCDGPTTNFSMLELLGCKNIAQNPDVTQFKYSESIVNVFIDPCHAIKLIRNAFGELRVFFDVQNRKIDYKYIEELHKLQEDQNLHLANKLTKAHVQFFKQKMKVRLATQLLSNSVADALQFCEEKLKLPQFQGCSGTVNFIRILNDSFDILNSHSMRPPGWKKALCEANIGLTSTLLTSVLDFLKLLRLPSGQLMINSRRKTGFIGLVIDIKSAMDLYQRLVHETKALLYLPMYKISQDHIELFFSSIRARGGFNNNPNAVQFVAAYKRLLVRAEIREHGTGNCIPLQQINILTCSSRVNPTQNINNLTDQGLYIELPEDDSELYDEFLETVNNMPLNEYNESVVEYIGGFIARKLTRSLSCVSCANLLTSHSTNTSISLILTKSRGGLIYPSKDVIDLLKKTEQLLKQKLKVAVKSENYYLYIYKFLLDLYDTNNIFVLSTEHDTNHKSLLIKSVIKCYLDLRYRYHGKKNTERITLRNYLNKCVLFRNE